MNQKIIIASKNPVKINASKTGFEKIFPDQKSSFEGVSVPSGVSDQPMTDKETLQGAINRAHAAKEKFSKATYWIGIEGGIEKMGEEMAAFAWVVILSNDKMGKARTSTFFLPQKVTALIEQGYELGEADDMVFGKTNSKQKSGAVGILTDDLIDRTIYYSEAVVLALIPFKNANLY